MLPLITLTTCVVLSLAFVFWRMNRWRRTMGPGNEAQSRFAMRFVPALLAGASAFAAVIIFAPMPIGIWGYAGLGVAYCAASICLLMWSERRLAALRAGS